MDRIYVTTVSPWSEPHGFHKGALLSGHSPANPIWRAKLRRQRQSLLDRAGTVSTLEHKKDVQTARVPLHRRSSDKIHAEGRS